MPLDKKIKFNHDTKRQRMPCIKFKNLPISIKSFTIKSNEKIYYNILINGHYLIYFPEYEQPYDDTYEELNEKYKSQNEIKKELKIIKAEIEDLTTQIDYFSLINKLSFA